VKKRFSEVADTSHEWIWEVDTKGMFTYSSGVIEKILGVTPDGIVGKKHL
jgi:PAS domain S-box-containing protein